MRYETERRIRVALIAELRAARLRAEMSQADVARASGMPLSAVSRFESGVLDSRVGTFLQYADAVGMCVEVRPKGER